MSAEDELRELLELQRNRNLSRGLTGASTHLRETANHIAEGVRQALEGTLPVPEATREELSEHFQGNVNEEAVLRGAGVDPDFPEMLDEVLQAGILSPERPGRFQVGREDPPPRYRQANLNGDVFPERQRQSFNPHVVSRRNPDGSWTPTENARHIPREVRTPDQIVAAAEAREANYKEASRGPIERPAESPTDGPSAYDRLLDDDWL